MTTQTELLAALERAVLALHRNVVEDNGVDQKTVATLIALRDQIAKGPYKTVKLSDEGHCPERAKPGGCQLHNLHCSYPACDKKPAGELALYALTGADQ